MVLWAEARARVADTIAYTCGTVSGELFSGSARAYADHIDQDSERRQMTGESKTKHGGRGLAHALHAQGALSPP